MKARVAPALASGGAAPPSPPPTQHIAVACSGGRDSLALLHATVHAAAKSELTLQVHALHVHHGLMSQADAWAKKVQRQCQRWARQGLPVQAHVWQVQGAPARGDSVEAWARQQRYAALAQMAKDAGAGSVLLAHHAADQAETFLLQALRGAGPAGLASMPAAVQRQGLCWLRPWLQHTPQQIESYVQHFRLKPVQDPSNLDERFARNRLRGQLMPVLVKAFAQAQACLGAAAQRAQEAALALQELAALDLAAVASAERGLRLAAWQVLPPGRRTNALRAWLALHGWTEGVPESLVQRLLRQSANASARRWPAPGGELRRHLGWLRFVALPPASAVARTVATPEACAIDLSRPGRHVLPAWGGCFVVRRVRVAGLDAAALAQAEVRARGGGERFVRLAGGASRSLKHHFQAAGLEDSARGGPLVWSGGRLLFVAGLGPNARALGSGPGLALAWQADVP